MHYKHIDFDYYFVRELVASKELKIRYVLTHLQIVDILAKSLGRSTFIFLRSKLRTSDSEILGSRGGGITNIEGSTQSSLNQDIIDTEGSIRSFSNDVIPYENPIS